jgi:hypothetical protein
MPKYNPEVLAAEIELGHLLADYWRDADFNDSKNATDFFTEDCTFVAGDQSYAGHAGVRAFYDTASIAKAGATTRHSISNVRISTDGKSHAVIDFLIVSYRKIGKTPISGLQGPAMVSDSHWDCRRGADDQWRIVVSNGQPIFLDDDSMLKKLAKS